MRVKRCGMMMLNGFGFGFVLSGAATATFAAREERG